MKERKLKTTKATGAVPAAEERAQSVWAPRSLPLAQSCATRTSGTDRCTQMRAPVLLKTEKNWKSPEYLTKAWFYKITHSRNRIK